MVPLSPNLGMNEREHSSTDQQSTTRLETVIETMPRDLVAGFQVRRVLPAPRRRMVGPFVFLDQMGPEVLREGQGLDVPPHPHIGLATVTWLFDGELLHRDSLGMVQTIRPGELNWMTAGRGIVHSERTPAELRQGTSAIYGLQSWVALPARDEEIEPSFTHYPAAALPLLEGDGTRLRLIAGSLFGTRSPVAIRSDLFYAEVTLNPGASLPIPVEHEERAIYVVEGAVSISGESGTWQAGQLLVLHPRAEVILVAPNSASASPAKLMLLGGEPLDGPRHIWWNFVSTSRERIEQARADWQAGRFPLIPGEGPSVPLPH